MLRMLHNSSGRNNFGLVKSDNKNQPISSEKQISDDQANVIEQQTREAIKTMAGTDQGNDKNNKNPK